MENNDTATVELSRPARVSMLGSDHLVTFEPRVGMIAPPICSRIACGQTGKEMEMKKILIGLMAVSTVAAASALVVAPAAADTVHIGPHGVSVHEHHHHHHRHWHHRHYR